MQTSASRCTQTGLWHVFELPATEIIGSLAAENGGFARGRLPNFRARREYRCSRVKPCTYFPDVRPFRGVCLPRTWRFPRTTGIWVQPGQAVHLFSRRAPFSRGLPPADVAISAHDGNMGAAGSSRAPILPTCAKNRGFVPSKPPDFRARREYGCSRDRSCTYIPDVRSFRASSNRDYRKLGGYSGIHSPSSVTV